MSHCRRVSRTADHPALSLLEDHEREARKGGSDPISEARVPSGTRKGQTPSFPAKSSVKHTASIQLKPFTVRPETAAALFEAPHLFQDMVKAGWIKPCYKTNRCTLYLVTDL